MKEKTTKRIDNCVICNGSIKTKNWQMSVTGVTHSNDDRAEVSLTILFAHESCLDKFFTLVI